MKILDLGDYRRRVAALYADLRNETTAPEVRHARFVAARDELFATHAQSALTDEQKATFTGLPYYPYNPAYRFIVTPDSDVEPELADIELREDGLIKLRRAARLDLDLPEGKAALSLFWIEGYGGGLFLPFRDATNGQTTYGGGRYLLDTIKHADLGAQDDKLVLDFNFAYNPSCAYNSLWDCPLAPFENRLELPVEAGERFS